MLEKLLKIMIMVHLKTIYTFFNYEIRNVDDAVEFYLQVSQDVNKSFVGGDVNQVQAIERRSLRNSDWKVGWGRDVPFVAYGGDTVGLLK